MLGPKNESISARKQPAPLNFWDSKKVDASIVIVRTSDKPITEGKSLLVILVIDNRASGIEWTALDVKTTVLSSGALIPK